MFGSALHLSYLEAITPAPEHQTSAQKLSQFSPADVTLLSWWQGLLPLPRYSPAPALCIRLLQGVLLLLKRCTLPINHQTCLPTSNIDINNPLSQ